MAKGSDNPFPSVLVVEGTVPTTPSAGNQRAYIDSTSHRLMLVNSSGVKRDLGGAEIDYVAKTTNTSVTATTEATANTVVTATATAFDGSTDIIIEFYSDAVNPNAGNAADITLYLYDGSSSIGVLAYVLSPSATGIYVPVYVRRRLTPAAATKTYSIRASVSNGTGSVAGGVGGAGANMPAFIRISRV